MKTALLATAATLAALPAMADMELTGDAAAGEAAFKQCQACHVVVSPDGETLAGRAGKVGPNLYGVIGREAGTFEDFRYGDALANLAVDGEPLVWDEEKFVAYVMDPMAFLKETTGDSGARGKMTFKVRKEEDAVNLAAYLYSLAPDANKTTE